MAWNALAGDDIVGSVEAVVRPDERCFLSFESCRLDAYEPLVSAAAEELRADLYVTIDEADGRRGAFEQLGFVVNRHESHYLIPVDPGDTGLAGVADPPGFDFVRADQVEEHRLRVLDDALRQDVPGTDGWKWDEAAFRAETFDSPSFDPATYLIAVEQRSGEYAGLVRVWNNPEGPRLGLVAVLERYRRRGMATGLLARAFGVLEERGQTEVSAEADETNTASTSLLTGLGARRTGGSIELTRRRTP